MNAVYISIGVIVFILYSLLRDILIFRVRKYGGSEMLISAIMHRTNPELYNQLSKNERYLLKASEFGRRLFIFFIVTEFIYIIYIKLINRLLLGA